MKTKDLEVGKRYALGSRSKIGRPNIEQFGTLKEIGCNRRSSTTTWGAPGFRSDGLRFVDVTSVDYYSGQIGFEKREDRTVTIHAVLMLEEPALKILKERREMREEEKTNNLALDDLAGQIVARVGKAGAHRSSYGVALSLEGAKAIADWLVELDEAREKLAKLEGKN